MPTLTTAQITSQREDLSNIITNVDPSETPFFSSIGKTKATAIRHEWLTDTLAAPTEANAVAEGADVVDTVAPVTERISNICQVLQKDIRLSGSVQAVNTAGAGEKARLTKNRGLEIRRDLEMSLLSGSGSVSSGTRRMAGYQAYVSTNASVGAGGSVAGHSNGVVAPAVAGTARALTEDMLLTMLQNIAIAGGKPSEILTGVLLKRKISSFSAGSQKQQLAKDRTITQGVDIYESDYSTLNLSYHPYALTTTVIAYDPNMFAVAMLQNRNFVLEELGKTGDSDKWMLVAEGTLEAKNQKSSGQIRDLNG